MDRKQFLQNFEDGSIHKDMLGNYIVQARGKTVTGRTVDEALGRLKAKEEPVAEKPKKSRKKKSTEEPLTDESA